MNNKTLLDEFIKMWQNAGCWRSTNWLGVPVRKNPCDLIIMQEILVETKPNVIIESGTHFGGSATFFASILDLLKIDFHIITIDIHDFKPSFGPYSERITPIIGSSVDPKTANLINSVLYQGRLNGKVFDRIMVNLDSAHSSVHVSRELELFHDFVSPGQYLILEDTVVDLQMKMPDGPHKAVLDFLKAHPDFEVQKDKERLGFTFNTDGYLRRKEK